MTNKNKFVQLVLIMLIINVVALLKVFQGAWFSDKQVSD